MCMCVWLSNEWLVAMVYLAHMFDEFTDDCIVEVVDVLPLYILLENIGRKYSEEE